MTSRQTRITAEYRHDDVLMMVLSKDLFSFNVFFQQVKKNKMMRHVIASCFGSRYTVPSNVSNNGNINRLVFNQHYCMIINATIGTMNNVLRYIEL